MNDRYSAAERAAILRQYERSGLELEIFAAWAGLRASRLQSWQGEADPAEPPALGWIEVELSGGDEAAKAEAARC